MNEIAPCGINCMACYVHLRAKKPCPGCHHQHQNKPEHCRNCNIKTCAAEHGVDICGDCDSFPCQRIKRLDASYRKRYAISLIENAQHIKEEGMTAFLEAEKIRWTCAACGDVISLHDRVCSGCGKDYKGE